MPWRSAMAGPPPGPSATCRASQDSRNPGRWIRRSWAPGTPVAAFRSGCTARGPMRAGARCGSCGRMVPRCSPASTYRTVAGSTSVGEEGPVPEIRRISPTEWAVYRGETYPAEERVPANVQLYRDGVPDQLVAVADLEQWYTVRTYGTFLAHEFEIYQERDGRLSIGVVGTGDGHW